VLHVPWSSKKGVKCSKDGLHPYPRRDRPTRGILGRVKTGKRLASGRNSRSDRRAAKKAVWGVEKKREGKGKERREEAREKGRGGHSLRRPQAQGGAERRRAEVGGGRSCAAATQPCVRGSWKISQGVAWLLVSAVVKVSVACFFSRHVAWLFLRVPCRGVF